MPPTLEARTADRAIACLRKAIEELAAGRPRDALAMVANAQDSASALRGSKGRPHCGLRSPPLGRSFPQVNVASCDLGMAAHAGLLQHCRTKRTLAKQARVCPLLERSGHAVTGGTMPI